MLLFIIADSCSVNFVNENGDLVSLNEGKTPFSDSIISICSDKIILVLIQFSFFKSFSFSFSRTKVSLINELLYGVPVSE